MSKIYKAFENKKAFIPFITAGDPSMEKTEEFIYELEKAGADLIEIGIPFSDPVAEGPVIQEANIRALSGGATLEKTFKMVEKVRKNSDIPLVFLTYANPVFHYGYDGFFKRCQKIGLDGIIIPDMPFEEQNEMKVYATKYGIDVINMIAPTSEDRITKIAKDSTGFIYVVSSMGVTGVRNEINMDSSTLIEKIKSISNTPTAVGFGINTPEQASKISKFSDGVIIGSAIVKLIAKHGDNANEYIFEYVKGIKNAMTST